ncbi:hypothetical protein NWO25_14450 [Enterococcus lactis]|nr:hypothetical protein [Enterococcus lactis]
MDSGFLWNITSTVLALFIPIATFLFENENAVDWDKMVVFDQVIKIKTVFWTNIVNIAFTFLSNKFSK